MEKPKSLTLQFAKAFDPQDLAVTLKIVNQNEDFLNFLENEKSITIDPSKVENNQTKGTIDVRIVNTEYYYN